LSDGDLKQFYILHSSTIRLIKDIVRGFGGNPKNGKKTGGIESRTAHQQYSHLLNPE
jgi:hypothetical protein